MFVLAVPDSQRSDKHLEKKVDFVGPRQSTGAACWASVPCHCSTTQREAGSLADYWEEVSPARVEKELLPSNWASEAW